MPARRAIEEAAEAGAERRLPEGIENLIWTTGYNVIALPLAAGVLAPIGIFVSPAAGAALMTLSSVIVALNGQLLRRYKFEA